ncbi:MAG: UvrD-helicase domain-containing protein [Bacilli bacterium]|nr:UvrD-helicase domain-containing protein [Bacilli bacterium]
MPRWTVEQQEAIDKEGCNIIVSAGAGSGKTAVLTARTIRKLKSGVNINEILILTFTNAAAFEMKERIRKAIKKEESLKDQLYLIDGAYITTFDSFSLSIVKKYHYLLNISKDVSIIDSSIIFNEKTNLLDKIMDKYYQEKSPSFLKLINDFCIKDDEDIKKYILNINDKMDLVQDKEEFLDKYISNYYSESFIDKNIKSYEKLVFEKKDYIIDLGHELLTVAEDKFYDKVLTFISKLENASSYEEIKDALIEKVPSTPPKSDEEVKVCRTKLSDAVKELVKFMDFDTLAEAKETILMTREYSEIIISIIKELDKSLMDFKYSNNSFEFNDIAKMAIKIVRDNQTVRDYLKYYFKEIMIDEYQDTSYLQESFIKLIENDDVYMVGDIKQSIYRFRNANPYIFKDKYDRYSLNDGGYKIDLLKNFRSRDKVLNNINLIFDSIMDDEIGGAQYQDSHRMIFGNTTYIEEGATSQNYDMEIYNYNFDKDLGFTKDEIEIFTIVKDIKEKVESHYQIFDKDLCVLRDVTYNDFCILLDRASKFDLYKKIFEYFNIPLTKYTSTNITNDDDISLIKNILSLIICVKEANYGIDFKYNFMSIGRSYLFRYSDSDLFNYINNDTYKESSLYLVILDLVNLSSYLSLSKIIEEIINRFSFYINSISVGDMEKVNVRCEYIINLSKGMEQMGFGISEFRDYLEKLISSDIKMECEISENISESVKIMTIHKSKGLEYHICYFAGFSYGFNISDLNDRFLFSEKYGIICPYFKDGIGDVIYKTLLREDYIKDEISEKIRLFYVALTRCKEKMIFVCNLEEEEVIFNNLVVDNSVRSKYRSFKDIMNSISLILKPYVKDIDINSINLSHDYNLIKSSNYKDKIDRCDVKTNDIEIIIANDKMTSSHYSKSTNDLINKDIREKMDIGTYVHYLLEVIDFNDVDYSLIDDKYKKYIEMFVNSGIDFSGKIFKEYEFIYEEDNSSRHGIIDLMIEYDDYIQIIDYKLKNVDDENYNKQLLGYKEYISKKTGKDVKLALYSIVKGELKSI